MYIYKLVMYNLSEYKNIKFTIEYKFQSVLNKKML